MSDEQAEAMMRFTQAVGGAILSLPDLAEHEWDTFALAAEVTDDSCAMTAYRYTSGGPPVSVEPPESDDDFWDLRDATHGPNGETWEVAVVKVDRATMGLVTEFYSGQDADRFRLAPETMETIAEALRPTAADFA